MLKFKSHISPHYYQKEAKQALYSSFRAKKDAVPCIEMETGSGKSVVIVDINIDAINGNRNILNLTHSETLVAQNSQALIEMTDGGEFINIGICCAGLGSFDINNQVTFASIQTFEKRAKDSIAFDICLIDEGHLVSINPDTQYRRAIAVLLEKNPNMRIGLLTASPMRLKQGYLHWHVENKDGTITRPFCTEICYKTNTQKLIDEGYLSKIVSHPSQLTADLSAVKIASNGDFKESDLGESFEQIIESAISEVIETNKTAKRGKTIIFASTIKNASHIAEVLQRNQCERITVVSKIDDSMDDELFADKEPALDWFKEPINYDRPRYLINVGMFVAGVNVPAIDHVVLLFATMSNSKLKQCAGRGLRTAKGKDYCLISDYGSNFKRLGALDNQIVKAPGNGEAPTKICVDTDYGKGCESLNYAGAKKCWNCDMEFYIEPKPPEHYTTLSTASALLESHVKNNPVYLSVLSVFWDKHEKQGKPASLKVSFYDDFEVPTCLIIKYFPLNSAKGFALSQLRMFFKRDADFYKLQNVGYFDKPTEEIAELFNSKGVSFLKKIVGFTYVMNGKFKEIEAIDFED